VRLGEVLLRSTGDHLLALAEAGDARGDHARIRHARLLRVDALHPHPDESLEFAFVAHRERESIDCLLGRRQR